MTKKNYLPFAWLRWLSDAKSGQKGYKWSRSEHLEFLLGHRYNSHGEIIAVPNICHIKTPAKQNCVFLSPFVLFVILLDLLQIVAHSLHARVGYLVVISFSEVLDQLSKCVSDESLFDRLMGAGSLLTKQVGRDFLGLFHWTLLQLQQLGSVVAVFVCLIATNKLRQECEARLLL